MVMISVCAGSQGFEMVASMAGFDIGSTQVERCRLRRKHKAGELRWQNTRR